MLPAIRVSMIATLGALASAYAQTDILPINDLPNPYRTVRDWGHPPNGAPWAAVTAIKAKNVSMRGTDTARRAAIMFAFHESCSDIT